MTHSSRQRPPKSVDPRLFIPWSEAASRDRLSSTLFIAGLLHGIILLGVTFSGDEPPAESDATSFDVVLVTGDYEDQALLNDAELLAQQDMVGAGNTSVPDQLKTALNQIDPAATLGPEQSGVDAPTQPKQASLEDRPTVVSRSIDSRLAAPETADERPENTEQQKRSFAGETQAIEIVNKPEFETLVTDSDPRELIISANTREARIAAYLSKWKSRVERVGTLNFPNLGNTAGLTEFPTLEVAIDADGTLRDVIVISSSGARNLDQAAVEIVNMSAPFDPFPEFLRSEYDVLRFAYEWRFTDGLVSATNRR